MGSLGINSFEPRKIEKKSKPKETKEELGYQLSDRRPGSWRNEETSSSGNSASHLNTAPRGTFMDDSNDGWIFQGGGGGASGTF